MTAEEERRAARRKLWDGGKVSLAEAADADFDFWRTATPGERLDATLALSLEAYLDQDEPAPRLRGSASGVRRA